MLFLAFLLMPQFLTWMLRESEKERERERERERKREREKEREREIYKDQEMTFTLDRRFRL